MLNGIPLEIISNIASIILVVILVFRYLKHKKTIDIIEKFDTLKNANELTEEDLSYIKQQELEFKPKSEKADAFAKFLNPVLFIYLPVSDAMLHLNIIVVAFIFVQLDKINKKNTLTLLKGLRKATKEEN